MPLKGGWIWLIGKVLVIGCEKTGGNGLTHLLFRAGYEVMGKYEQEQSCLLAWKRSQI